MPWVGRMRYDHAHKCFALPMLDRSARFQQRNQGWLDLHVNRDTGVLARSKEEAMPLLEIPYQANALVEVRGRKGSKLGTIMLRTARPRDATKLSQTGKRVRDQLGYYMVQLIGDDELIVHVHESNIEQVS